MLADSPDGLLGHYTTSDVYSCAAIEGKTMASPAIIVNAKNLSDKYAPLSKVSGIGRSEDAGKHFKKLVFTPEYRFQCIHHSVALGLSRFILL